MAIKAEPVERELIRLCVERWTDPPAAKVTAAEPFTGQAELDKLTGKRSQTMALFQADALTPDELAEALAPIRVRIAELEADRRRWVAQTTKAKASLVKPLDQWNQAVREGDVALQRSTIRAELREFRVAKGDPLRTNNGRNVTDITRVTPLWLD